MNVSTRASDPFLDVREDPWYQPVKGPPLSGERWEELRMIAASWRTNDEPRPVASAVHDRAIEALRSALDEIARLRGSDGAG